MPAGGRGNTRIPIGKKRQSKSAKAGLVFSVARILRKMKTCNSLHGRRISKGSAVYLTAVVEYLMSEVLELAGNSVKLDKKKLTSPKHIMMAIMGDAELKEAFSSIIIPGGGVMPSYLASKPKAVASSTTTKKTKKSQKSANYIAKVPKPVSLKKTVSFTELSERTFELGRKLCVAKGDITDVAVEAIVMPSSSNFSTSGMVGSALVSKGGSAFQNEISRLKSEVGTLKSLEACRSTAFGIKSSHIIFVNGPTYSETDSKAKLEESVMNCIKLAMAEGYRSIAFPSIGSGNAHFPKQLAAETILRVIRNYLYDQPVGAIESILFLLYDRESVDIYKAELSRLV